MNPRTRTRRFARLLGDTEHNTDCPCRGCNASGFAAGQHVNALETLAEQSELHLFQQGDEVLVGGDLESVLEEWHNAVSWISLELRTKLAFCMTLPWLIAGLVHPCYETARTVVGKTIAIQLHRFPYV